LNGQLLDKNHAKGLIATNAVASLAATHNLAKDFVEALWNTPVPSEFNERYYDGLLYLMSMLSLQWGVQDMASRLSIKKNPTGNCKKSKSVTIASAALFRHFAGQAFFA